MRVAEIYERYVTACLAIASIRQEIEEGFIGKDGIAALRTQHQEWVEVRDECLQLLKNEGGER